MSTAPKTLPVSLQAGPTVPDVGGDALAFATDGRWAVAEGLRLHLGRGVQRVATVFPESGSPRGPLTFAPDGHSLLWGSFRVSLGPDGTTAHFTAPDAELLAALEGALPGPPGEVEIAVATRGADDAIRVIVGRRRPSMLPGAPGGPLRAAAVSIADGVTHVLWSGPSHSAPVRIALTGDQVALAGAELLISDARTGRALFHEPHPHQGTINALVFSPAKDRVYTAAADGTVTAWSLPAGGRAWSRKLAKDPLRGLAIDPAGALLATCGWDDTLHVLPAAGTEHAPLTLALGAHGEAVAFSLAGDRMLVGLSGARAALQFVELLRR